MAERFTADLLFIVIALLIAALLGYLIGYYLAKGKQRKLIADLEAEKARLEAKIRQLEEEKLALQGDLRKKDEAILSLQADMKKRDETYLILQEEMKKKDEAYLALQEDIKIKDEAYLTLQEDIRKKDGAYLNLQADVRRMDDEIASLKLTIDKLEKEARILAEHPAESRAAEIPVAKIAPDDLKAVIGIGPKISQLLINRGITTWKALSQTSPDYLREILDTDGGERFRINNPESWPHQALLLHEGRWDELKELQGRLIE